MLQAALNGTRTRHEHRATPLSSRELAADAMACMAVGALAFHVHPRDEEGVETLDPAVVDEACVAIYAATGLQAGVSTGAWIEPDPRRRVELVRQWTAPSYASVNLVEPDAAAVMDALLEADIAIEAGVWSPDDAERLAQTGLADRVLRVLVEVHDPSDVGALGRAQAIHDALDAHGITAPRLQHGTGAGGWVLLRDAAERGLDTRIGLEDTLVSPRGGTVRGNLDLVQEALSIIGRAANRTNLAGSRSHLPSRPSAPDPEA